MEHLRIILSMAARNLMRGRGRTLSTLIAITVGLLGLTLLDGFITYSMNGFRDAIIKSGTGHIQVARSPAYFDEGDTNPIPFLLDDEKAIEAQLASIPGVKDVMPTMAFSAAISEAGTTSFVQVSAYPTAQARAPPDAAHDYSWQGPGPGRIRHDPRGDGACKEAESCTRTHPVPFRPEQGRGSQHGKLHDRRHKLIGNR